MYCAAVYIIYCGCRQWPYCNAESDNKCEWNDDGWRVGRDGWPEVNRRSIVLLPAPPPALPTTPAYHHQRPSKSIPPARSLDRPVNVAIDGPWPGTLSTAWPVQLAARRGAGRESDTRVARKCVIICTASARARSGAEIICREWTDAEWWSAARWRWTSTAPPALTHRRTGSQSIPPSSLSSSCHRCHRPTELRLRFRYRNHNGTKRYFSVAEVSTRRSVNQKALVRGCIDNVSGFRLRKKRCFILLKPSVSSFDLLVFFFCAIKFQER